MLAIFMLALLIPSYSKSSNLLNSIYHDYIESFVFTSPEKQITFHLYHSIDTIKGDLLCIDDALSLEKSNFNSSKPTKFIIHGWMHNGDVDWVVQMREAMLRTDLWNIIIVDWSPLSVAIYSEARRLTTIVGQQLTLFLLFLSKSARIKMSAIHLIGHSMGAQVSGFAGHAVNKLINEKIGRITGLDPAAPLFEWPTARSLDEILDSGDANFVDVIHTNGKHFGIIYPAGHVDYYPNGGRNQPGCSSWVCSHMRSCEFWTASVKKPDLFKAYPFKSWHEYLAGNTDGLLAVPMGIAANSTIPPGCYFLEIYGEFEAYSDSVKRFENLLEY